MKIRLDISKIAKSGNRHREMGEGGAGQPLKDGIERLTGIPGRPLMGLKTTRQPIKVDGYFEDTLV